MNLFHQILVIAGMLSANFYVVFRLWHMIPATGIVRPVFLGIAALVLVCFFLFFVPDTFFPVWLDSVTYKVGTSWFFIMIYLLIIFLLADILRICGLRQAGELLYSNWISFMVLVGVMGVIFTAGHITYHHKKRTELTLDASSYPGIKEPVRIVGVSDLHLGYNIGPREFTRWIDQINAENPDMVIIAGDLIDNSVRPLYHYHMETMFERIKTRYGIFMVPGNHEYYAGMPESEAFLSQTNITLLRDSATLTPAGIYILGRDDKTNHKRKNLQELVVKLDPDYPVVLLDHQPYNLEQAQENDIFLQFSGHTHRGQIWPVSWITDKIYEVSYGYARKGNTHYYVSSGLGLWGGKFRIGTQSEYVVINITR